MQRKHILLVAVSTVLLVFLVTVGWEFFLEGFFEQGALGHDAEESVTEHWEYVLTATFAAAIAVSFMVLTCIRTVNRLGFRVEERTRDLEKTNDLLIRQINEHKQTMDTLRESEDRYRDIVENVGDLIQTVGPDGRYQFVNKAWKQVLGYDNEDLETLTFADVVREDHLPRCQEIFEALGRGESFENLEVIFKAKDSREVTVEGCIGSRLENGEMIHSRAIFRDITERKLHEEAQLASKYALQDRVSELEMVQDKMEKQGARLVGMAEDLDKAHDEAEAANRAKTEFLATMSHELRTPLNAIIGFSEIIETETLGPVGNVKYRDYASDIHVSGHHLLDLINDILDLSKVESGLDEIHEEAIEIPELAHSVWRLIQQPAEQQGVRLVLELPEDPPALYADQRKLKQILVNLMSNAIKFTEAGGTVTMNVWFRGDSGYVFQVVDTGIGIALTDIPKALSQFGQIQSDLNRQYQGSGLGLPLTKALVELHGGTLDLQSEVGVGTTVTVRFPTERIVELPRGAKAVNAVNKKVG